MKKEIKTSSKKTNNIDSNLNTTNNTNSTNNSTPDFSILLQKAKTFYNEIVNTLKALENYFTEQYNIIRLNFTKASSFISQLKQNSTIILNNSLTLKEAVKKETNVIKSNIEALKKSLQKETEKTLLLKHNKNRYLETIAFNKTENTIITMNLKHLKTKIEINKKNLNELNNKIISSKNDNQMYVSKEYSINNLTYEASLRIKRIEDDNLEIKKEIAKKDLILREKKKEYEDKNQIVVDVLKENEEMKRSITSDLKNLMLFDSPGGDEKDKNKGNSMDNTVDRSNEKNNFLDNFCSVDTLKDEFNSIRDFQSSKIDNYLFNVSKEFEFYKKKTSLLLELYNSVYTNNISDKKINNMCMTIKERLEHEILAYLSNLNINTNSNNYNINNYYTNNYGIINNNNNDEKILNDLNTKLMDLKQESDMLHNECAMVTQNNQDLNNEKKTKQEEVYFLTKSHYNKALLNRVFKSFKKLDNYYNTNEMSSNYENNDNKEINNVKTQNCSVFKSKRHNKSSSIIKNKSFVIEDESIFGESKIKLTDNSINKTTGNDREIKLVSVLKKPKDSENFYSDNNNTNNISNNKTNDISNNKSNKQLNDNKQNKKDLIDDIKYMNYNDSSQLISGLLTSNNKQHSYRNINLNKLNEDSGNNINNKSNDNKTQKRVSFNIPEDTNTKNSYTNVQEMNNCDLSQYININDTNILDDNNTNNNSSVLKLNIKKKKKKGKNTLSGNNNITLNGNSNNNNGYSSFFDMNILKEVTKNINDVERDEKSNLKKLMNKYLY